MPDYDFRILSPYDFEVFVRDVLQAEWEIRLESFKSGRDRGIDLRYAENIDQSIVVQCKRYYATGVPGLLRDLKRFEAAKVAILKPNRYVFVTSLGLTPDNKSEIQRIFEPFCISTHDIYGREDLNNLLSLFPAVEKSHSKLWLASIEILEHILHSDINNQTKWELEEIKEKSKYFVQHEGLHRALDILEENHFVIISGPPGIGKTTLARMLILAHLDKDFTLLKVTRDIEESSRTITKESMIFYYDDFLGQTSLEDKLGKNEDGALIALMRRVQKSKHLRLILTTREYILSQAQRTYALLNGDELKIGKCILSLQDYSKFDKAHILYNHLHFSELPDSYKEALVDDKSYWSIIEHENYNPRIVEWMSEYRQIEHIPPEGYLTEFLKNLQNPQKLWSHAFESQLKTSSRNLLLVLYTLSGEPILQTLESVFESFHLRYCAKFGLEQSPDDFHDSLKQCEGTFVETWTSGSFIRIKFQNPSVVDFLHEYLATHNALLKQILQSALRFQQLNYLWGTLGPGIESKPDRDQLTDMLGDFEDSMARVVDAPYRIVWESGNHRVASIDSSLETRLQLLESMKKFIPRNRIHEYLRKVIDAAYVYFDEFDDIEHEEFLSLNRTLLGLSILEETDKEALREGLSHAVL